MVDGKAKLLRDDYCDGLGDCLPGCPVGAISFEIREAEAYDEAAVKENLAKMKKDLPVFFIAGGDDPVGSYGKGIHKCVEQFKKAGMTDVSVRVYPLCRHEILNEINKEEIFEDVGQWIEKKLEDDVILS